MWSFKRQIKAHTDEQWMDLFIAKLSSRQKLMDAALKEILEDQTVISKNAELVLLFLTQYPEHSAKFQAFKKTLSNDQLQMLNEITAPLPLSTPKYAKMQQCIARYARPDPNKTIQELNAMALFEWKMLMLKSKQDHTWEAQEAAVREDGPVKLNSKINLSEIRQITAAQSQIVNASALTSLHFQDKISIHAIWLCVGVLSTMLITGLAQIIGNLSITVLMQTMTGVAVTSLGVFMALLSPSGNAFFYDKFKIWSFTQNNATMAVQSVFNNISDEAKPLLSYIAQHDRNLANQIAVNILFDYAEGDGQYIKKINALMQALPQQVSDTEYTEAQQTIAAKLIHPEKSCDEIIEQLSIQQRVRID